MNKWIEFALKQGGGICNTGNHLAIVYGQMDPKDVPPSWTLVVPSGNLEQDRQSLIQAFERKV